jgi:hypothetical protein
MQALLTNEQYKGGRCFSSSNNQRSAVSQQSSNSKNDFRTSKGSRGGASGFGRLTKMNMKSVEDEIEEEMSSGEEEFFD